MNKSITAIVTQFVEGIHFYKATMFNPKAPANQLFLAQAGVDEIIRALGASVETETEVWELKSGLGIFAVKAVTTLFWEEDGIHRRHQAQAIATTSEAKFQPRPLLTCPVCGNKSIKFTRNTPYCDSWVGNGCTLSEEQKANLKRDVSNIEAFPMINATAALDTLLAMAIKRSRTRVVRGAACLTSTFADDASIGFDNDGTFAIQGKVNAALSLFGTAVVDLISTSDGRKEFSNVLRSFYTEKGVDLDTVEHLIKTIPDFVTDDWFVDNVRQENPRWSQLKPGITLYELLWLMEKNCVFG